MWPLAFVAVLQPENKIQIKCNQLLTLPKKKKKKKCSRYNTLEIVYSEKKKNAIRLIIDDQMCK